MRQTHLFSLAHTYLDILPLIIDHFLHEVSRGVHRTDNSLSLLDDAIVLADTEIILPEARGLVTTLVPLSAVT